MRRVIRISMIVLASIIVACISGCFEDKHQTVEWYLNHKPEREAKLEACRNDAAIALTPDCLNAERAYNIAISGSSKSKMPSLVPNGMKLNKLPDKAK